VSTGCGKAIIIATKDVASLASDRSSHTKPIQRADSTPRSSRPGQTTLLTAITVGRNERTHGIGDGLDRVGSANRRLQQIAARHTEQRVRPHIGANCALLTERDPAISASASPGRFNAFRSAGLRRALDPHSAIAPNPSSVWISAGQVAGSSPVSCTINPQFSTFRRFCRRHLRSCPIGNHVPTGN
jgi:hypothetical protein